MKAKSLIAIVSLLLSIFSVSCTRTEKQDVPYNDISFYKNVSESQFKNSTVPNAVVKINIGGAVGTGFFASKDGILISNNHVIGNQDCFKEGCFMSINLYYQKGSITDSEVLYAVPLYGNEDADISVFQTYHTIKNANDERVKTDSKYNNQYHLTISSAEPSSFVGEKLSTIGHPLGALKKVTELEVFETNGHDLNVQGAIINGQSGSPVVTASGEVVGLVKTGTTQFTSFANRSLNVQGGVVSIKELAPYFQQAGEAFYSKSGVPLAIEEFASIEDEFVQENWLDYYPMFRAIKKNPKGLALSHVDSPVVDEFEKRCEGYVNSFKDGVISHVESQKEYSITDCSRLASLHGCKNSTKDAETDSHICASEERQKKWASWMVEIVEQEALHNGEVYLSMLRRANSLDDSIDVEKEYYRVLRSVGPTLTFSNLETILSFKMGSYETLYFDGVDLVQKFEKYKQDPNYYLYTNDIILGLSSLYNSGYTSVSPVNAARGFMTDPKVSLSAKLRVEATLYRSGSLN